MDATQIPRLFKGENFLTPERLECGIVREGLYFELSHGVSIFPEEHPDGVYGVTLATEKKMLTGDPRNKCFFSKKEARAYINGGCVLRCSEPDCGIPLSGKGPTCGHHDSDKEVSTDA